MSSAAVPVEIQDLIDNPREALHLELKRWLNLTDEVARAKVARHLAALANHGGGYLIFGFEDDGIPATLQPGDSTEISRDVIAGIIDKYLTPAFQCDVLVVPRGEGRQYPVVRVASHGKVPICSKRNGPHDSKNNPQGIRMASYYIRLPGPKSVAIETPEQWHDLIHRCVINERETLLESLSKLLLHPPFRGESSEGLLKTWHDEIRKQYMWQLGNEQ